MIVINAKWAVELDSAKLNYSPLIWEAEKEVKNPKTGKTQVRPAQWVHLGLYFPNMQLALKEVIYQEAKSETQLDQTIQGYVQALNKIVQDFQDDCLDTLERRPTI